MRQGMKCAMPTFLHHGMASLLAITEDGQTVDICTIGNEGVIGLPIVLNVPIMALPRRDPTAIRGVNDQEQGAPRGVQPGRNTAATIAQIYLCAAVTSNSIFHLPLTAHYPAETLSVVVSYK